jgi:LysM repeat protein
VDAASGRTHLPADETIEPGPWDAWTDGDAERESPYPGALPPRRRQPREWAAPPPWAGAEAVAPDDADAVPPPFLSDRDEPASAARPSSGPRSDRPGGEDGVAASAVAGLAASPAARAARSRYPEPEPDELDDADYEVAPERPDRRRSIAAGRLRDAERDQGAPPWEPRRRSEAYPSLRNPVSLPRLGPLAGALLALVAAALVLFFVVPGLLKVGDDGGLGGGGGSSPSPATSIAPSPSAAPATPAAPTPQVYVVKQGDTLSKIAKKFGLTIDELIEANQTTIKDPDKIGLGDQIIIPAPSPSDLEPADSTEPSPSA